MLNSTAYQLHIQVDNNTTCAWLFAQRTNIEINNKQSFTAAAEPNKNKSITNTRGVVLQYVSSPLFEDDQLFVGLSWYWCGDPSNASIFVPHDELKKTQCQSRRNIYNKYCLQRSSITKQNNYQFFSLIWINSGDSHG